MDTLKNKLTILVIAAVFAGCAYSSMVRWAETINWDRDGNDKLTQYEFVRGYAESNYFRRWGSGRRLSEENFLASIFDKLDQNQDRALSAMEFNGHIDFYDLANGTRTLSLWDSDGNGVLSISEFNDNARATGLLKVWDTSQDNSISEDELANGMFDVCDLNGDRIVSSLEFNIWKVNR